MVMAIGKDLRIRRKGSYQYYARLGICKIYVYITHVTVIVVSSPGFKSTRNLTASPAKGSRDEDDVDEFAAAPFPKADMKRAPRLSLGGVDVGEDARAAQV